MPDALSVVVAGVPRPLIGALVRGRWVLIPLLAALATVVSAWGMPGMDDAGLFTRTGCQLLEGHVGLAYSNPELQSGPLQVALYCGAAHVTGLSGLENPAVWSTIAVVAVTLGLLAALPLLRRHAGLNASPATVTVAAAYFAVWVATVTIGIHSAEVLTPAMWVTAAVLVRRHPVIAGLVLGATAGVEMWGLVAVPIVFAAPTARQRVAGAAAAAALATLLVVPFALAGHLAMFTFEWPVLPHTLPALIWPVRASGVAPNFGVLPRVLQLALAAGGCAGVAYRVRHRPALLAWLPALTAEYLRLLVDPTLYPYYWVVPELLVAAAVVCSSTSRQKLLAGLLAVLPVAGALGELQVIDAMASLGLLSLVLRGTSVPRTAGTSTGRSLETSRDSPTAGAATG